MKHPTESSDEPSVGVPHPSYVLLAEGDVVRSASLIEALTPTRLGALVARDSVEALQIVEEFGPPLVLVISLSLAKGDPFAVMKALRIVAGPERAAIIVLTPWADAHRVSVDARRSVGISAVLPHSASAAVFLAAVDKASTEVGWPPLSDAQRVASLTSRDVLGEILRDVVGEATRLTGAPGAVVYLQVGDLQRFRAYVDWASSRAKSQAVFEVPYALEWIARTGEALVIPDLTKQSMFASSSEALPDIVRGIIAVPLLGRNDHVLGALCVFDVAPLNVTVAQVDELKRLGSDSGFLLESQLGRAVLPGPHHRSHDTTDSNAPATAAVDVSTGLLPREVGPSVIKREAARAAEAKRPVSLLLIAPDPLVGSDRQASEDHVLRKLVQTVTGMLRTSDVAIRWRGDEVLILLPMIGVSMARAVAERIRASAQGIRSRDLPAMTVSAGVWELPPGASPDVAVNRVEQQLMAARSEGGNRVH